MIFRVAAKHKHDGDLAIFWLNNFTLGMEVDQARNFLVLSLSLLALCTYGLVVSLRGHTI